MGGPWCVVSFQEIGCWGRQSAIRGRFSGGESGSVFTNAAGLIGCCKEAHELSSRLFPVKPEQEIGCTFSYSVILFHSILLYSLTCPLCLYLLLDSLTNYVAFGV